MILVQDVGTEAAVPFRCPHGSRCPTNTVFSFASSNYYEQQCGKQFPVCVPFVCSRAEMSVFVAIHSAVINHSWLVHSACNLFKVHTILQYSNFLVH